MGKFMRPYVALCVALAVGLGLGGPALGQSKDSQVKDGQAKDSQRAAFHPTKPVTLVVPYSPGGGTDSVARLLAKALEELWGQTVVVDNRPGANGSIGAALVARAAPDGYTLLLSVSGFALNAHLMKLPYDTATAFAPITAPANLVATIVASPTLPTGDLREFIELVRKEGPDKRTVAIPDPGSRLTVERIFEKAGIKVVNIPYKGGAAFMGDISAGRVDLGILSVTTALSLIRAGHLKSLGLVSTERIGALPQVSTLEEQGIGGFERDSWCGLFAPAGTPPAIVDALQHDVATVVARPEFQARLAEFGALPSGGTPAEFNARFQNLLKESGEMIRRLGMTIE